MGHNGPFSLVIIARIYILVGIFRLHKYHKMKLRLIAQNGHFQKDETLPKRFFRGTVNSHKCGNFCLGESSFIDTAFMYLLS